MASVDLRREGEARGRAFISFAIMQLSPGKHSCGQDRQDPCSDAVASGGNHKNYSMDLDLDQSKMPSRQQYLTSEGPRGVSRLRSERIPGFRESPGEGFGVRIK